MEENKSKVYVLLDERNRIIQCDGGYTINNVDVDTWTYIDEGTGDKYNLCQTHYFDKSVREEHGVPQYKYENNKCVERTRAEIDADISAIPVPIPISTNEELEQAICELEETYESRLADIENAICELDGGNSNE